MATKIQWTLAGRYMRSVMPRILRNAEGQAVKETQEVGFVILASGGFDVTFVLQLQLRIIFISFVLSTPLCFAAY